MTENDQTPPTPDLPEEEIVEIEDISVSSESEGHKVILKEKADSKGQVEMFVGGSELAAIAKELGLLESSRPLPHELYTSILEGLDIEFEKLLIYGLSENAYLARLEYKKNGQPETVEIRPSDGVALALKHDLPIRLNRRLLKGILSLEDQATMNDLVKAVKF
jgi:uncharacterized protein